MASPQISAKPDLGSLRIHDGQRSQSKMGKRLFYASIPVLIFAGIVAGAYALRSQRPVVEVATAAKPDVGGRQALPRLPAASLASFSMRARALPKDSCSLPSMMQM